MIYGRALKSKEYSNLPFFADIFKNIFTEHKVVSLNNPAGIYRLHLYGVGGRGGNGSYGSTNAGGGGAARGGIGVAEITLPANSTLEYFGIGAVPSGTYLRAILNGKSYSVGWGIGGGHGSLGTGGDAGSAPPANIGDFNLVNYSPSAGSKGYNYSQGAFGGAGSSFQGDISIAHFTNHGTAYFEPNLEDSETWVLGTGGDGGKGTTNSNNPERQGVTGGYAGVILERV